MIDLLRERRSIRKYEARGIEFEKVEILKEALLRSPSSMNRRPWEFIFVDDKDLLARLSRAKEHGAGFLRDAALGIVVCGDETVSDVWQEDCSIAAIIVQLAAQSIGLGSCWVQIRNRIHVQGITSEKYIQGLLGLPENLRVECIISLGYPAEKKAGIPKEQMEAWKDRIRHLPV